MKLVVGLGNPGSKYGHTRHNFGRLVVESIARRLSLKLTKHKPLNASLADGIWDERPVTIAHPETYMNISGRAVRKLTEHLEADPEQDLLVLSDDLALPLGVMRLRSKGSDGGHNGLKSVEESLGIQTYARLRLGIGPVTPGVVAEEFVLERFRSEEQELLEQVLVLATEACRLWLTSPIEAAMNVVNSGQIKS